MIPARPTTKKTSGDVIMTGQVICRNCKRREHLRVVPAERFVEFETECASFAPLIASKIERGGVTLPIAGPVNVAAVFYRDADIGDLAGYLQALGDVLQSTRISDKGKITRKGVLGIITDDKQIVSWDGSRLSKDSVRPRIECVITVASPRLWDGDGAAAR